ncbi:hypothetical protein R3P38DRAFT_3518768 [Favolaschia claudopus]|uniref:Uncharacterized protein n=1 Tax=Favolaschia claudopus TaxID=2862362 RepID=A0AAW0BR58_9AGAR
MLSAEESALAIFGVVENTDIAYTVQSLANSSGFSVIVRPTDHDPAPTLLSPDPPNFNTHNNPRDGEYNSSDNNRSHSWDEEDGFTPSGQNQGITKMVKETTIMLQLKTATLGAGGGDGGDGGCPPTTDDQWESPLHRTRVKLDLQVDDLRRYAVILGCSFKFKINRDTDIPIDLADLTRPLSQPEVISLFDITIETRPRETQVDRSYANFGFIAHRAASIVERTFLHRGFEQPDKIYKHGKQRETQQGVKASFGFSQGSPLLTSSFSYNWNNNLTMEATDNKAGRVDYEPGDEWDNGGRSFSSYNIAYQPQDALFRQNSEPIQNYLDNIRTPKALCISEQQLIKLAKSSYQFQPQEDQHKSGTISLSVATVQKPIVPSTNKLLAVVPRFNRRCSETVSPDIPPHEYLARGWDANNEEWRSVLWPALDKDFRAADVEGTLPVWKLQCPWRSAQAWNESSSSPFKD